MALDDDLFIGAMVFPGWIGVIFGLAMIGVMCWQCSQSEKCEKANSVYVKDLDMCVDNSALSKPQ